MLEAGNSRFCDSVLAGQLVEQQFTDRALTELQSGADLAQQPFAAVIGCADARVPIELIFGCSVNDLFVVRVAGNVLGDEVIGSIDYAISYLPTIRLVVVLGHRGCGAVGAAVRAYLDPATFVGLAAEHQLRTIVNQIYPAVRLSHAALLEVHGDHVERSPAFEKVLAEITVTVNAAVMAASMRGEIAAYDTTIRPMFGVYDLESHLVGLPARTGAPEGFRGLVDPPEDAAMLTALALDLADAAGTCLAD